MVPVRQLGSVALAGLLRRQPLSAAKVRFAWELAAGRPMARAAEPRLEPDGTLRVWVTDRRWAREIARLQPVWLDRLRALLGPEAVARVELRLPE